MANINCLNFIKENATIEPMTHMCNNLTLRNLFFCTSSNQSSKAYCITEHAERITKIICHVTSSIFSRCTLYMWKSFLNNHRQRCVYGTQ